MALPLIVHTSSFFSTAYGAIAVFFLAATVAIRVGHGLLGLLRDLRSFRRGR
jgi:hypothetical protein